MEFKDIIGYENTHCISNTGVVVSKARKVYLIDGRVWDKKKKVLKWNYQKGYPTMCLYNKGYKRFFVHRLVYETFIGKIPVGMQINHINGIKSDSRLENLEVVTPKQNSIHAWKTGLSKKQLGESCSTSKLKDDDIRMIRLLNEQGVKQTEIAKKFKLHQTSVHYILKGKTWNHVT